MPLVNSVLVINVIVVLKGGTFVILVMVVSGCKVSKVNLLLLYIYKQYNNTYIEVALASSVELMLIDRGVKKREKKTSFVHEYRQNTCMHIQKKIVYKYSLEF